MTEHSRSLPRNGWYRVTAPPSGPVMRKVNAPGAPAGTVSTDGTNAYPPNRSVSPVPSGSARAGAGVDGAARGAAMPGMSAIESWSRWCAGWRVQAVADSATAPARTAAASRRRVRRTVDPPTGSGTRCPSARPGSPGSWR
jgi:hypothetical protein